MSKAVDIFALVRISGAEVNTDNLGRSSIVVSMMSNRVVSQSMTVIVFSLNLAVVSSTLPSSSNTGRHMAAAMGTPAQQCDYRPDGHATDVLKEKSYLQNNSTKVERNKDADCMMATAVKF